MWSRWIKVDFPILTRKTRRDAPPTTRSKKVLCSWPRAEACEQRWIGLNKHKKDMGCAGSTPAEPDAPLTSAAPIGENTHRAIREAGAPPQPVAQQPSQLQLAAALEASKQTAAQEKKNEEDLQAALAMSSATAASAAVQPAARAPPRLQTQTSEEQLQTALALSRSLAAESAAAVKANVQQLVEAVKRSTEDWAPPPTWAKGVGTAFELLDASSNTWAPITNPDLIDQLGRLAACNPITEVEYAVDGASYKTTMRDDGLLAQVEVEPNAGVSTCEEKSTPHATRHTPHATRHARRYALMLARALSHPHASSSLLPSFPPSLLPFPVIRLVPFFFEYAEAGEWKPIVEPEALTALTAVLASSSSYNYQVGEAREC